MKNIKRPHKIHKTDKQTKMLKTTNNLLCRTLVVSGNILFSCL